MTSPHLQADFGLSRETGDQNQSDYYQMSTDIPLPLRWLSPEAIQTFSFSTNTDVYSYGILIFEVMSGGDYPFGALKDGELLLFLAGGDGNDIPSKLPLAGNLQSHPLSPLLKQCLRRSARSRPPFSSIVSQLAGALDGLRLHGGSPAVTEAVPAGATYTGFEDSDGAGTSSGGGSISREDRKPSVYLGFDDEPAGHENDETML